MHFLHFFHLGGKGIIVGLKPHHDENGQMNISQHLGPDKLAGVANSGCLQVTMMILVLS